MIDSLVALIILCVLLMFGGISVVIINHFAGTKESTPSASHNSVSREIKCSNRECDFRNKNGVCTHRGGPWCPNHRTLHPA